MSSMWQPAYASLDEALTHLSDSVDKLRAAKSVDVAEVVEQLATAAEAARNLRSFVASILPDATWQNREDLDGILKHIHRVLGARSRLEALAVELERGSIVHRRAVRVSHLTELRDLAVQELRSHAGPGEMPPSLPGPEADQWIEWACGLKEPEDAEALETLRSGFAQLDNFIVNLEPGMWKVKTETPV